MPPEPELSAFQQAAVTDLLPYDHDTADQVCDLLARWQGRWGLVDGDTAAIVRALTGWTRQPEPSIPAGAA
jgi:hypothetical protein